MARTHAQRKFAWSRWLRAGLTPLIVAAASAPGRSQALGQWSGPWSYQSQLNPNNCPGDFDEIAHAALIPAGPFAGKILMWRRSIAGAPPACQAGPTTETWLFYTENPNQLVKVDQALQSDIFCGGASWNPLGKLLVVGGFFTGAPAAIPKQAYRFDPLLMRRNGSPTVPGAPWVPIGDMNIGQYYPTVIESDKDDIASSCVPGGTLVGGAQIVLSGPPLTSPGGANGEGMELWPLIEPTSATWNRTLTPPGGPLTSLGHNPTPGSTLEAYRLEPAGNPLQEFKLDTYARAFLVGDPDPVNIPHVGAQVLVAFDVDTAGDSPAPNTPGLSWVMKLPIAGQSGCWEFWAGPASGTPGSQKPDRYYGTAVSMSTRRPLGPRLHRVLLFGGSFNPNYPNPGVDWIVTQAVQEFVAATVGDPFVGGSWQDKTPLLSKRVFLNVVVLATGQIFIEGGGAIDDHHNPGLFPSTPQSTPELYDPGDDALSPGSTMYLAQSNVVPANGTSTPRLYHHLAVLQPDGSVWIAGGYDRGGAPPLPPDSRYTAEVYYPPYFYLGARPFITSAKDEVDLGAAPFTVKAVLHHSSVKRVVLTRPAAVTHHFDNDQRYIELEFQAPASYPTGTEQTITVTPPHQSLGPPGYYMLWVVEETVGPSPQLVPSEARFVRFK